MKKNLITEIVRFRVLPDISEERFIKIVDDLEVKFHMTLKGYVDSELVKSKEGTWIILMHWETREDVKAAGALMMKEAASEEFRQTLDPKSVKIELLEQIGCWEKGA